MAKKTEQQLANEQRTAEITGTYAENVQREGTKQELVKALTAKFSMPKQTISPTTLLIIVVSAILLLSFLKKQNVVESK